MASNTTRDWVSYLDSSSWIFRASSLWVPLDGGWWILEIKHGGRAWHAERWSPEGAFRSYCDRLARLAESPKPPY